MLIETECSSYMFHIFLNLFSVHPSTNGGRYTPPPPTVFFCPLLKISLGNPYLKILDLPKRYVADANMKS